MEFDTHVDWERNGTVEIASLSAQVFGSANAPDMCCQLSLPDFGSYEPERKTASPFPKHLKIFNRRTPTLCCLKLLENFSKYFLEFVKSIRTVFFRMVTNFPSKHYYNLLKSYLNFPVISSCTNWGIASKFHSLRFV